MDFKLKGKSWAGNIYHQFESICQDVDGIMSKDTVKYVENQVQSVGESVKNFYSNVVQDILPLVGDNLNLKAQSSTSDQVAMKDDVNSVTGTRTESNSVREEQPSMEQGSTDNAINSSISSLIELEDGIPFTKLPCSDPSQEAQIHLHISVDGGAMVCNDANSCIEENITRNSLIIPENSSSKDEIVSGTFDDDYKNSMPITLPSLAHSDLHARILATKSWLLEGEMPKVVEGSNSIENRSLSATPILPADKVHEDNRLSIGSPLHPANGHHEPAGKDEILCDRFTIKDESSDVSSVNESSDVSSAIQSSTNNQVGMKDDVNSVRGTRTESNSVYEEQPSMEQGSTDNVINFSISSPIELDDGMPFTKLPCSDPSLEAHIHLHLSVDGGAMVCNDANSCTEEIITRNSLTIPENSSSKDERVSGTFDEDNKNSMPTTVPSPVLSDLHARILATKNDESSCNLSLDDLEYSNISIPGWLLEGEMLKVVEGSNSIENRSLSAIPVLPADKVHEDKRKRLSIGSPLHPANEDHEALGKDEILRDRFTVQDESSEVSSSNESSDVSSAIQSSDVFFSYFSCNDKEELGKSIDILESTSGNFIEKAENLCNSESDCHERAKNVSTSSPATAAYETTDPALSNLESNDNCASLSDESVYVVGGSQSRHKEHENAINSNYSISSSESGNKHDSGGVVSNLNLETVDLCDNAEHNRTNVILNGNISHAASHKRRNFRYYKKLIQEAFASRKRFSKEYEHLAILYGDIDKESRQLFEPSSLPAASPASLHAATLALQENIETEWELL